jgi:hypothetical protein
MEPLPFDDSSDPNQDDPADLFTLGWDNMQAKNLELAEFYWRKGVAFTGPDPWDQVMNCMDCLGVLLANSGRIEEAEYWWKESVRRFRNSDSQRHLDQLNSERNQ